MSAVLYLLFFLSGAAGLMYEAGWARYLGLFVGHEAYAQVLVLVIFLGGMALGAAGISRKADSYRHPLRRYAAVEATVGLIGLLFHPLFVAATGWAYQHGFPAVGEGFGASLIKWGLAGLLILPQSILLGTTFPLMSAGVLRHQPRAPGRVLGWLYFSNSFGAAVGVLLAGFLLIGLWGLPGVVRTAAVLNLFVAVAVILVISGPQDEPVPATNDSAPWSPGVLPANRLSRLLLLAAFLTAVASFSYEIDWIRMLSLVLGSATHSFELMLSAFILGLALGAFWIRRRIDQLSQPLLTLAIIQVCMGVLAVATLPLYVASFRWMTWLLEALASSPPGYAVFNLARYAFCLAVMLPATVCAGMTLPLITRILLTERRSESVIGQVYSANTLGSILGASLAALLLLPLLGIKGLLVAGGLLDIAIGGLLLAAQSPRTLRRLAPAGAAGLLALAFLALPLDRRRLVSGVFRSSANLDGARTSFVDYYSDGPTATVSVLRGRGGFLSLSTNGKVDASRSREAQQHCDPLSQPRQLKDDEITQVLTGVLPLAYLGPAADVVMIGMGSGVSTHMLLASPAVRSVTTVEIEPRMVEAARLFSPANRRAYEDPRSRIVIGDARAFFATARKRFGAIVSEPSNPWVSGVSALFTEEFYRRVRDQLAPDGVFVQWLQTYELDDASVLRVLRALSAVFPDWRIHQAGRADLIIVATPASQLRAGQWEQVAALPALRQDLCGVIPLEAASLEATLLADAALLGPAVAGVGAANSDFFPLLDLRAEGRRFEEQNAEGILLLGDEWFNLARQLMGRRETPIPVFKETFDGMRRSTERYLQTWQTSEPPPGAVPTSIASRVRYEWQRWRGGLRGSEPPNDWKSWLAEFRGVSAIRHAGTAGWTDDEFFREAEQFARVHRAPPVVQDIIAFRRAVQAWDTHTVLDKAERLADSSRASAGWILARDLVDPAVIAAAALGRQDAARAWLAKFAALTDRDADDIRSRILNGLAGVP